ncbi:MAG: hypothetical protein FD123_3733 [Bacteroidetes bacterium]|nr:MAG: hypothetical protein FD123_3733 [Bacteroidota bacterium]
MTAGWCGWRIFEVCKMAFATEMSRNTNTRPVIFFVLISLFYSCGNKSLLENMPIAQEIMAEAGGKSGNLYFVTDEMPQSNKTKYYIEFNINQSSLILKDSMEKIVLASYCATQLYKRLTKDAIENNYGFNITFDNEMDPSNIKKYFFTKDGIKLAISALANADKYINHIVQGDFEGANALIDTSYFDLNRDSLNSVFKQKIGSNISKTSHFYKLYEYTKENELSSAPCFTILTIISKPNNNTTTCEFLIPVYEAEYKIINLKIH